MCELDAAYFHLYGIERDDADYIMETFPIVKRRDEAKHGEYRAKRVIVDVYDAMKRAKDCDDKGPPFRWDVRRRAALRAQMDVYYTWLYGVNRKQIRYILEVYWSILWSAPQASLVQLCRRFQSKESTTVRWRMDDDVNSRKPIFSVP